MRPYPQSIDHRQQRAAAWLTLLLALFALRVVAQPLALHWPGAVLPAFDDWHSAALPYGVLLASQCVILALGLMVIWHFYNRQISAMPRLGDIFYHLGWVYWGVMWARLFLGMTVLNEVHWFAQTLPALFHLLLANFLMIVGDYLRTTPARGCLA